MRTSARGEVVLVALVFCSLVLGGCSSPDARCTEYLRRGQHYLTEGNLLKAQVEFRNAMQIAPTRADARVMSGRVAEKLGDVRDALALYQSAIYLDSRSAPARASLGRLYVFAGAPSRALEVVRPALLQHPDDPDLLTVRGAARAALKDGAGALADAQRAVEIAPLDEDAVGLLAALYQQDGNVQRAIDLLRATLAKRPNSRDLHQILASLYIKLGRRDLADTELGRIVELEPKALAPRYALASFYEDSGQLDKAERVLKDAVSAQPDQDEPKLAYIEFLTTYRSPRQAEGVLAQFVARNAHHYDLQLAEAALLQQVEGPDAAIEAYRHIIARAEDHPQGLVARDRLAAILVTQRRFDEASSLIAQVLEKNARDANALIVRANIAVERGEPGAAVADLRAVLRDQPRSSPVLRALASAYLADGESALAEESLRSAVDAAPEEASGRIELAQLLTRTDRLSEATALLAEGVRRSPRSPVAREALVRAYIANSAIEAARETTEEFERLAPDDWRGPYLTALIAAARHRPQDAEQALERSLALRPDAMPALTMLARLETASGHADRAVARLRSAAGGRPSDAAIYDLLGETLLNNKDSKGAIAELTRSTQLDRGWWVPYHDLGAAQLAAGDTAAAIRTYEQGIVGTHQQPGLVSDLASLYERVGRIDDAIRAYEALHREFPGMPLAANNLAMLLATYRKDPASLERARDLTAGFMSSTNTDLLDTAGWVRLKSGDTAAALTALEEAARRAPHSPLIRYHLGMAQLRAGQRDRARASLESALAGAQRFAGWDDARLALARLGS